MNKKEAFKNLDFRLLESSHKAESNFLNTSRNVIDFTYGLYLIHKGFDPQKLK